jgi:hypothetical protein
MVSVRSANSRHSTSRLDKAEIDCTGTAMAQANMLKTGLDSCTTASTTHLQSSPSNWGCAMADQVVVIIHLLFAAHRQHNFPRIASCQHFRMYVDHGQRYQSSVRRWSVGSSNAHVGQVCWLS